MAINQANFRDDGSGPCLFTYRAMMQGEPWWHRATDSSAEFELGRDVMGREGDRRLLLVFLGRGWYGPRSGRGISALLVNT